MKTFICKSDLYKGKIRLFVQGGRVDFIANQPANLHRAKGG